MNQRELEEQARVIRRTLLKQVAAAGSGHPGGSLSVADILTALYFKIMNISSQFNSLSNN